MGVAQQSTGIYWYVGGSNPFVQWVTDIVDEANPPTSNSISWGSIEQVCLVLDLLIPRITMMLMLNYC
jgi:hypothetical protein